MLPVYRSIMCLTRRWGITKDYIKKPQLFGYNGVETRPPSGGWKKTFARRLRGVVPNNREKCTADQLYLEENSDSKPGQTELVSLFRLSVGEKELTMAVGAWSTMFLSYSLITMQNLVTVSHTVYAHIRVRNFWRYWGSSPVIGAWLTPRTRLFSMCYRAKFGPSRSNCVGVGGVPKFGGSWSPALVMGVWLSVEILPSHMLFCQI